MRTIRVTGKGMLRVKPDTTRITLTLEGERKDYAETLCASSDDTERLKTLLEGFGFAREDLKTLFFNVDTAYESYEEEGVYRQRFKGYRYRHEMKAEFPNDNDRLGRILAALANSPVQPQFGVSYTVKDPEALKNQLLERAVADAKEKAAVLARAAGVPLGAIQSVDYSWGQIDFEVHPMDRLCAEKLALDEGNAALSLDVQPDDIEAADTVTVVWEIG